ncbi:MAG: histidine ammonia-lyase, partial [Chromatiales bacterium]
MSTQISARAADVTLSQLRDIWQGPAHMSLDETTMTRVRSSQQTVRAALAAEQPVYGINTGFGMLANVRIPDDHLVELQENLILSHCAGIGENLDDRSVRLILVLKILSLAQGYSGVSPEVIVALSKLLNHEVYPCVPSRGSVGASGDLAPLA